MEGSKYSNIIFSKIGRQENNNYIILCFLSNVYNLFSKIITIIYRLDKKSHGNQPREQAVLGASTRRQVTSMPGTNITRMRFTMYSPKHY